MTSHSGAPFGFRREVVIAHPLHGPLVSAQELLVVPSFWGLLEGELKLKRLLIEQAVIRLRVVDGKVVNLPELAPVERAEDPDAPVRIPLDELVAHHARLVVDAAPRFVASLHGVNVVARGTTDGVTSGVAAAGHRHRCR